VLLICNLQYLLCCGDSRLTPFCHTNTVLVTKIASRRCLLQVRKYAKIVFGRDSTGGACSAPSDPLVGGKEPWCVAVEDSVCQHGDFELGRDGTELYRRRSDLYSVYSQSRSRRSVIRLCRVDVGVQHRFVSYCRSTHLSCPSTATCRLTSRAEYRMTSVTL